MGTDKKTHAQSYGEEINTDIIIRECTKDDLEGVIKVNEKELPEDYPYFFYKSILDSYSDAFLVATKKTNAQKIVGYIMWRVERAPSIDNLNLINKGHLVSIAVLTPHRRQGVATALLSNSMPEIKNYNISEYVLEVRVSNYSAINLYKKFGYVIKNIKKNYYRDGENAYYMVKKVED
jgi:ribosomal-protein-alanine N-acetyltransferase